MMQRTPNSWSSEFFTAGMLNSLTPLSFGTLHLRQAAQACHLITSLVSKRYKTVTIASKTFFFFSNMLIISLSLGSP